MAEKTITGPGESTDSIGGDGNSLLHNVTRNGILNIVRSQLDKGAINQKNKEGLTPLHIAAMTPQNNAAKTNQYELIKILLSKAGVDVNVKSDVDLVSHRKPQQTPLHYAAADGNVRVITLLLDNRADVEAKDVDGFSALARAVLNSHLGAAKLLVARDANVISPNNRGRTPLHFAASSRNLDIVELLLAKSPVFNINDYTREICCIADKEGAIVLKLLLNKCDKTMINSLDHRGKGLLHYAVKFNNKDLIIDILEKGADINLQNEDKETPLHIATKICYADIVRALLEKKAKTDIRDWDGKTAPDRAQLGRRMVWGAWQEMTPKEKKALIDAFGNSYTINSDMGQSSSSAQERPGGNGGRGVPRAPGGSGGQAGIGGQERGGNGTGTGGHHGGKSGAFNGRRQR